MKHIQSTKYLREQEKKRRDEQRAQATAQQRNAQREAQAQREQQAQREATRDKIKDGLRLSYVVYSDQRIAGRYLADHGFSNFAPLSSCIGTQGLCCLRGRQACLAFRGTDSLLDVAIDLLAIPRYRRPPAYPDGSAQPSHRPPSSWVHFGFDRSWRSIRNKVRGWLRNHEGAFDSVALYGHSLGGAIAHVAALELSSDYEIAEVVTFGAPRSSFLSSAQAYDDCRLSPDSEETLGSVTLRVVNKLDLVAKLPSRRLGYRHVGHLVYLSTDGQVYLDDEARHMQDQEGFLEPAIQLFVQENAAFYDASPFSLTTPSLTSPSLTSHSASLSASAAAPTVVPTVDISAIDISAIRARLQEQPEEAPDGMAAPAMASTSPSLPSWQASLSSQPSPPLQPSPLSSFTFTRTVELPSLRTLGARLLGWYRQAKTQVPLVQVPAQMLFVLIAPFVAFAGTVLFLLRSSSSHLKLDYARYFLDATTQFDRDLAKVKSQLGIRGSSKVRTIAGRVVKAIVMATAVLGMLYVCFWLFTRWTWPLLLDWTQR
jgi:pimeloyl-ACP methyl ester carboxylesterase